MIPDNLEKMSGEELVDGLANTAGGMDSSCTPDDDQKYFDDCRTELLRRLNELEALKKENEIHKKFIDEWYRNLHTMESQ